MNRLPYPRRNFLACSVIFQINGFCASDVGTYECFARNDHGESSQAVVMVLAQHPEFLRAPTEVSLIGVNGGKIECQIFGVPKPKVSRTVKINNNRDLSAPTSRETSLNLHRKISQKKSRNRKKRNIFFENQGFSSI